MPPQLIVLRHGESQWNHENKFCGWIDIELTKKGRAEAAAAGQLILDKGLKPTSMYLSKLKRLIETGQIVAKQLQRQWMDDTKLWRLNERHYGQYQGRDKHDVFMLLGNTDEDRKKLYQYIRRDIDGTPPLTESIETDASIDERYDTVPREELPRGESLRMAIKRLIPFVQEIIDRELRDGGRTVLLVTHGLIVRGLIKTLSGVSDEDISKINVPNGIPLVFEYDEKIGKMSPTYYYLDKEMAMRGMDMVREQGLSRK